MIIKKAILVTLLAFVGFVGQCFGAVEDLKDSLVIINRDNSYGTGFFIHKHLLLTNYHVVGEKHPVHGLLAPKQDNVIDLQLRDGEFTKGVVVRFSKELDLALLYVPDYVGAPIALGSADAKVGQAIYSVGHGDYDFYETAEGVAGYYSKNVRADLWNVYLQLTDLKAGPGDSGSPIVDSEDKLVGVISGGIEIKDGTSTVTMYVPVEEILKFLQGQNSPVSTSVIEEHVLQPLDTIIMSYVELPKEIFMNGMLPYKDIEEIAQFCVDNGVQIYNGNNTIIFEGPTPLLKVIVNFILRGTPLVVPSIEAA